MAAAPKLTDVVADVARLKEVAEESAQRFSSLESTMGSISRGLDTLIARIDRLSPPSPVPAVASSPSSSVVVSAPPPPPAHVTRPVKLDFPKFNGNEPLYWLFRAEQFFAYYATPDDQRLIIASVNMEGSIIAWFQMLQKQQLIPTWAALAQAVEMQFGPTRFDSPRSRLFKLSQTSTAAVYYTEFLVLSTRVHGMSDDAILDCFVSGLRPSLRRDVTAHGPQTLIRAAELARLFDDTGPYSSTSHQASSRSWSGSPVTLSPSPKFSGHRSSSPVATAAPSVVSAAVSASGSSSPAAAPPYKRLTAAELRAKREKGLCYYCEDKYAPGHKCKPTFFLLLGPEEFSEVFYGSSAEPIAIDVTDEDSQEFQALSPEISLHALEGEFHPRTLRLTGFYKRESLKILVDSGSTLNFLKGSVARRLKLPLFPVTPFRVRTGGGEALWCTHKCVQVAFTVQDIALVADFLF